MTDKQMPTGAELEALLLDKLPASKHYIRPVIGKMVAAMQAAIDKWGQPAQAAEPVERLEIESLKAQLHAAKQINAAQFGLLAASIPGSALRASHGQAPADAKALAEADRRAGEAERLLATCKEDVMRFEQVRSRMKYQWGADQRVLFDEIWDEALALKKAAQTGSVQEDAARYRWLRDGNDAKHGAAWHVAVNLYGCEWDAAIDAARKQGENHDR